MTPLSKAAETERRFPPPWTFVGALQDRPVVPVIRARKAEAKKVDGRRIHRNEAIGTERGA